MFVEGTTEAQYLAHWHRANREHVLVTVDDFRGGPLQLVQHAVTRLKEDRRAELKGKGRTPAETWCMFDIDEHPNIARATDLAAAHGVRIAVSNPCLELWFLLHFKDQRAWIHRHVAQQAVGSFITRSKVLTPADLAKLMDHHDDARARAQQLARMHETNGSSVGENPSSTVWRLVDSIRPRSSN